MAVVGRVEDIPYAIKHIEWSIDDYFTVIQDKRYCLLQSPNFYFAEDDAIWYLMYYPREKEIETEFVGLYLYRSKVVENQIEYTYGLKKCDGSVVQLFRGIMGKGIKNTGLNKQFDFIRKEELLHRKSELVPDNTLTIICTVKVMTEITLPTQKVSQSYQKTALDEKVVSKLTRLDKLSDNFKDLFADKETCDVTLRVQDKEYKAHKSVLMARSRVFAATFKHDTLERQTGVITISDCDPDSFQKFLEYLYSGELEQLCFGSAMTLYYTSDKYELEELKEFCVEYLMHHLTVENVCDIAAFADKYDEIKLLSEVQDFFNENVKKIFVTSEWESFLKNNHRLVNKLLIEMSKVKIDN